MKPEKNLEEAEQKSGDLALLWPLTIDKYIIA
jgi:hypothetical protein